MANYSNLKAAINAVIKQNGQGEITGEVMNQVLTAMVNSLGSNYLFAGVATPSTNPGTPDQNVFYMATQAGTYTNFSAIVLQAGISILLWNGSWSNETFYTIDSVPTSGSDNFISSGAVFDKFKLDGGAYDVSAHNNNQTFASLSALLNDANLSTLIPTNIRSGGMSIRFVQSSDNKYVKFFCTADEFTTDISAWQGVDNEPTVGSDNLVKSGSVYAGLVKDGNRLAFLDGNTDGIGWSNSYLNGENQSDRQSSTKHVSCIEPFYIGKGNVFKTTLKEGFQLLVSYFQTADTDKRSSYSSYNGENKEYIAEQDYAIFTFRKQIEDVNQDISVSEAMSQLTVIGITNQELDRRINVTNQELDRRINVESSKILNGKTVSIVGDSISSFTGYSAPNYNSYYPNGNVDSVDKTWWYHLIVKSGATLGENVSVAGARVSSGDAQKPSLITQASTLSAADIIILEGVQNDYQSNVQIGILDITKETSLLDDSLFADAYLHYVRIALEKANELVVCVITNLISEEYARIIREIANYYGCLCIDLTKLIISKIQTSHPNYQGMMMMAETAYNSIAENSNITKQLNDLHNRIYKYPSLPPKGSEYVNLGTLINANSSDGSYTLTYNRLRLCTEALVFVGKGNTLIIQGSPLYAVSSNHYSSNVAGASRVAYTNYETLSDGGVKIPAMADYILLTFKKVDESIITSDDVYGYGAVSNILVYKENLISKEDFYSDKGYNSFGALDLSQVPFVRGKINTTTGEVENGTRHVSPFLAVKPCSRFWLNTPLIDNVSLDVYLLFYHVDENGNYSYDNTYTFSSSETMPYLRTRSNLHNCEVIVPATANAFRFYVEKSDNTVATIEQIRSSLLVLNCHSRSKIKKVESGIIKIDGVIDFNKLGIEWLQGLGWTNERPGNRCIAASFFEVYAGQRIAVRHCNKNKVYQYIIYEYETLSAKPVRTRTFGWNGVYIPSVGVKYIRITTAPGTNGASSITPQICVEDTWYMIDVSGNHLSLPRAEKLIERSRTSYAQGMAIQNGYLFQAFADGYIDIISLETLEMVQSVFVPVSSDTTSSTMHCNNLTFGDKYDADDAFGVLWVNNEGSRTNFIGVRVLLDDGVFSFTKVYEVTPPQIPEEYKADDQYFDFKNKIMVQIAYLYTDGITSPSTNYSDVTIWVYSWSGDLQDGNFTLIHSFDFPIIWAMQGGRLINGVLYLVSGPIMNAINVFNVLSKELIGIIDLTRFNITNEAQGFDWDCLPYLTSTDSSQNKWWLHKLYL